MKLEPRRARSAPPHHHHVSSSVQRLAVVKAHLFSLDITLSLALSCPLPYVIFLSTPLCTSHTLSFQLSFCYGLRYFTMSFDMAIFILLVRICSRSSGCPCSVLILARCSFSLHVRLFSCTFLIRKKEGVGWGTSPPGP